MEKRNFCEVCNNLSQTEIICDTCGKQLSRNGYLIYEIGENSPIKLNINDAYYDFCNYTCLLLFILEELKK